MACHMDLRQWLPPGAPVPRELEMYGFCEAFGYVNKVRLCTEATPQGLEIPFKPKQLKEAERLARQDAGLTGSEENANGAEGGESSNSKDGDASGETEEGGSENTSTKKTKDEEDKNDADDGEEEEVYHGKRNRADAVIAPESEGGGKTTIASSEETGADGTVSEAVAAGGA